jgi:ATP-dependent Clp protease protease subunit
MVKILADHTGKSPEEVVEDIDRDRFMSAQEACDYGLVDKILEPGALKKEKTQ